MKTSVETSVIDKLTVSAWSSVKEPLLIAALSFIHFLLSNCIRSIQNWILDSLNLYDWVTARFLESSFDVLVLLHIFWRIQLKKMYSRLITQWILWLRSPVIWYLNIWRKIFVKSKKHWLNQLFFMPKQTIAITITKMSLCDTPKY